MFKHCNSSELNIIKSNIANIVTIKLTRKKLFPLEKFDFRNSDLKMLDIKTSLNDEEYSIVSNKIESYSLKAMENTLNCFSGKTVDEIIKEYKTLKKSNKYKTLTASYSSITSSSLCNYRLEDALLKAILKVENFSNTEIKEYTEITRGTEHLCSLFGPEYIDDEFIQECIDTFYTDNFEVKRCIENLCLKYSIVYYTTTLTDIIIANHKDISDDAADTYLSLDRGIIKEQFALEADCLYINDFDINIDDFELDLMGSYGMWDSYIFKISVDLTETDIVELNECFDQERFSILSDPYTEKFNDLVYDREQKELTIQLSEAYSEVGISPLFLIKLIELFQK